MPDIFPFDLGDVTVLAEDQIRFAGDVWTATVIRPAWGTTPLSAAAIETWRADSGAAPRYIRRWARRPLPGHRGPVPSPPFVREQVRRREQGLPMQSWPPTVGSARPAER
jgi:hypothetical protein